MLAVTDADVNWFRVGTVSVDAFSRIALKIAMALAVPQRAEPAAQGPPR